MSTIKIYTGWTKQNTTKNLVMVLIWSKIRPLINNQPFKVPSHCYFLKYKRLSLLNKYLDILILSKNQGWWNSSVTKLTKSDEIRDVTIFMTNSIIWWRNLTKFAKIETYLPYLLLCIKIYRMFLWFNLSKHPLKV